MVRKSGERPQSGDLMLAPRRLPPRLAAQRLWASVVSVMGCLAAGACQPSADDFSVAPMEMAAADVVAGRSLSSQEVVLGQPRLIRSGAVRIEVEDLDASIEAAEDLVREVRGFVAGSDLAEGSEGSRSASLTLRVPSDSFQVVVDGLSDLGRVLSVSVNASDVSRQYYDIETRLAIKNETVARLQELLTRSGDLEDLLAVERELGRATAELESLKGQISYYDQRLALSDLRVDLLEPGAAITSGALRPVTMAFRNSVGVLAESVALLVYLLVFLAPWLVLAVVLWPLARRIRPLLRRKGAD